MKRIVLFLLTNAAVVLVASITLQILGVDHYISGSGLNLTSLLIFCAVFGMAGSFVSLFMSKWMAKTTSGAQVIDQPRNEEEHWLVETVAELAGKAGIGMPEVAIFPAEQANAFATGWNRNDSLVAVSSGLLQRFHRDEIRAILGHEIGHVANGDMVTLALIQGVVNTFVLFFARIAGYVVDSALRRGEDNGGGVGIGFYITTFVFEIIFGFVASMIVCWFSRKREYRADAAGAALASRDGMISSLYRLKAEYGIPDELPSQMTAFGINGHIGNWGELFATHPPLDDRIAALQQGA